MKVLTDYTCDRCGCTASYTGVAPADIPEIHTCPDGGRSDSFSMRTRTVLGPGERGRDDEAPR